LRRIFFFFLIVFCPLYAPAQDTTATLTLAQAIESTLRQHPQLQLQEEQVRIDRGALLRSQSQFDRVVQGDASISRTYTPLTEIERALYSGSANTNFINLDASATQQFRNGISAVPVVTVTRTTDNLGAQTGCCRDEPSARTAWTSCSAWAEWAKSTGVGIHASDDPSL